MPTRRNGSNFSPTQAPCPLVADQFLRSDFRLKNSTFLRVVSTASRKLWSARKDAATNSDFVTASCSTVSRAPPNRSVRSSNAASPLV